MGDQKAAETVLIISAFCENQSASYTGERIPTADMVNCSGNFTGWKNEDAFLESLRQTASVVLPIFYALVLLMGVVGNTLVIYVILANKCLQTCPKILFLNLAAADLLFLLIVIPFEAAINISKWELRLGNGLCKLIKYTTFVTMSVNAYSLSAICVFRCRAIMSPIRTSKNLTRRHAISVCVSIWVAMLCCNIPVAVLHREEGQCAPGPENAFQFYLLLVIFSGVDFILPLTIKVIATLVIVYQLKKTRPTTENDSLVSMYYSRRLIILVVTVTTIFVVCWGPFHVLIILHSLTAFWIGHRFWIVASIVSLCMGYSNACINPIIYNFLSKEFRKAFRQTLTRLTRRRGRPRMHHEEHNMSSFKSCRTTSFHVREQHVSYSRRKRSPTSSSF